MKNPSLTVIVFAILALLSFSCSLNMKRGNGEIVDEEIEVSEFDKINVGGNYDVVLIKSNETKVVIKTDENLIRYINVEIHDHMLSINSVHNLKGTDGILIKVFYEGLNKIYSSGASKIDHEGPLKSDDLQINLSGAGAIALDLETSEIDVTLSGAGVINLSGETDRQETHISGAGGLMAKDLISKECNITLSGLGGAEVYVTEKLTATITGVGGIVFGGNPKLIEKQVTGFGKIERAKEYTLEENN